MEVKGMKRWAAALMVLWLVFSATTALAGYRGPFEGRVVDAETRQPIQGAVVSMEWDLGHATAAGRVGTFYDAAEVLTDEHGYFRIKKKWSWNPWTNRMLDARALIYKAGYGSAVNLGTPWLLDLAASQRTRSPEERRDMGPHFYLDIEFDDGLPVFLLRKLATPEERRRNLHFPVIHGESLEKLKLLRAEENRERAALGMEEY
jgi:hypothetical protein